MFLGPPITGQPAKPAQRANLFQKYSVLGPLSGGSTKPGPLAPDLYIIKILRIRLTLSTKKNSQIGEYVRFDRTISIKKYSELNQEKEYDSAHDSLARVSFRTKPKSCSRIIIACLDTLEKPPASLTVPAIFGQFSTQGSKQMGPLKALLTL